LSQQLSIEEEKHAQAWEKDGSAAEMKRKIGLSNVRLIEREDNVNKVLLEKEQQNNENEAAALINIWKRLRKYFRRRTYPRRKAGAEGERIERERRNLINFDEGGKSDG